MIRILTVLVMAALYAYPASRVINKGNCDKCANILTDTDYSVISYKEHRAVNMAELVYMYKGRITRWSDGSRVVLFAVKLDDREQLAFARDILGIGRNSFKQYLRKNKSAIIVKNKHTLVTKVSQTVGSLAMISRDRYIMNDGYGVYEVKVVEE